ncbi:MAG: hypothetical protein VB817_04005, partial [Pirellulaceae bacterium]
VTDAKKTELTTFVKAAKTAAAAFGEEDAETFGDDESDGDDDETFSCMHAGCNPAFDHHQCEGRGD